MAYQPASPLEADILDILNTESIMEFDDTLPYAVDQDIAPCTHDDHWLCLCRRRWFAREIAAYVEAAAYEATTRVLEGHR